MRKAIAILLFTIISVTATEGYQVFKISVLLHHFQEHLILQPNLSFLDYISEHYTKVHHHDEHDNSLPYQHDECFEGNISSLYTPEKVQHTSIIPYSTIPTYIPNTPQVPEIPYSDIWQPPKI